MILNPSAATIDAATAGELRFLGGGGEAGSLMRGLDWSASPLGHPTTWPQSLRSVVGLLLNSKFPMFVAWGPDLGFLYNDAYGEILGAKHPAAMGARFRDIWAEIWTDIVPMIDAALAGEGTYHQDLMLVMNRKGYDEKTWFTFSYSPLRDEAGDVAGMFCAVTETTDRVLAERRLASERERLATLFEQAPLFMAMVEGPEHRFQLVNHAYLNLIGREDIAGKPVAEVVPEAVRQGYVAMLDQVYQTGEPVVAVGARLEVAAPGKEALTERYIDFVISPLKDAEGSVTGILVAGADVTGRVQSERRLSDSAERLRLALDAADIALWELDVPSGRQTWPPRIKEMFGISQDAPVSMQDFHDGLHPDDRDKTIKAFEAVMDPQQRAHYDVEYRTVGKEDGVVRWVAARGRGFFDDNGQCLRVIGTAIDVSARQMAAIRLRESEDNLRKSVAALDALIENAPIGFAFFDREYRYVRMNSALADINGMPIEAHLGRTVGELFPRLKDQVAAVFDHVFETGQVFQATEISGDDAGRHGRAWLNAFFPVFGADGKVAYVGATVVEITEQKRAEQVVRELNDGLEKVVEARTAELTESERRFRAIFNTTFQLTGLGTLDGAIVLVNQAALDAIHATHEMVQGMNVWDAPWWVHSPEEQARVKDAVRRASAGEFVRYDASVLLPIGLRTFDFSLKPVVDENGRPVYLLAEARDITDQRLAEDSLRQAQKMEAVGQLTGGIAHDFNNLLQGVSGALELICRQPGDRDRVLKLAGMGLEATGRGARLTAQLLAFSRSQKLEVKPVHTDRIILGLRELLERTLGPTIRITLDAGAGTGALTDAVQLEMALLNLAINARDAMPSGGDLTITSRRASITGDPELPAGDYVEIRVTDTGTGMPPDIASKAFDPFFTTKRVGEGTGLGLSQVYGSMRQAGGTARIRTAPNDGTTLVLLLRATDIEAEASQPVPPEPQAVAGRRRVLVIDDDAMVRQFVCDALEMLDYEVLEAEDGCAGVAAFDRSAPDVVVVDFAMPGMTGDEVARQIHLRAHNVPIIFITGYSDTRAIEAVAGPDAKVLRKPFAVDDLRLAVADELAP